MLCDYHLHTSFSADSDTPLSHQVEQAIRLGMAELCVTDHHDYGVSAGDYDFNLDFASYLPALLAARERYRGKIAIRTGIELGLQCHIKDYLEQCIDQYGESLDFIIGSSHFINGMDPYYPDFYEGRTESEAYRRYFEATCERVRRLDCFDVLGHLDYVVRYGPNKNRDYSFRRYQEYIDPILTSLIEKGKGLECNTGGYRAGLAQPNPCEDILRRYRELGGEVITVGSDAHSPEQVGYAFGQAKELLTRCGFRYYVLFRERRPVFCPLDD